MKKLAAFLLTFTFVFILAGESYASPAAVASVTVSGPESYTRPMTTSNKTVVDGLLKLIGEAEKSSVKAGALEKLATVEFGGSAQHEIFKLADGTLFAPYYVKQGNSFREIDAFQFDRLTNALGRKFYRWSKTPSANFGLSPMPIINSSYRYQKLNGRFYHGQWTEADEIIEMEDAYNIQPVSINPNAPQPKSVEVIVWLSSGTDTSGRSRVWSGELKPNGHTLRNGYALWVLSGNGFRITRTGRYQIRYIVKYDSEHYKGEVEHGYEFYVGESTLKGILSGVSFG